MFSVGKAQVAYKKDDVWLVKLAGIYCPLRIIEIEGRRIRHLYGWEPVEKWHRRSRIRLGRVRRILGFPLGWKR